MDLLKLILENRGMTWSDYMEMSDASYQPLLDIDKMADVLDDIYKTGKHIVIYPDFDMDGDMSGVVLYAGLSELGFNVDLFVPSSTKGYGMHLSDIDELVHRYPTVDAIITCDVGISEFESVQYAKDKGLLVLITDHHVPQQGNLVADVVVNPNRVDDTYANKSICGAHVAWQVLDSYVQTKRNDWFLVEQINHLRVFAGIGTVSDMMILSHENRALVNDSVSISRLLLGYDYETGEVDLASRSIPQYFKNMTCYSDVYRRAFFGLSRLYYSFAKQSNPKIQTKKSIDASFYGFYVAPMFNSLKRLGGDMNHAFGVFFDDLNKQQGHIDVLFETNEKRKRLVDDYMSVLLDEVDKGLQPLAPYIYTSDAPAGIVGLLATKLISESGLPTLVLSGNDMDGYHGSGRSPYWYLFNSSTKQYNLEILASKYKMTVDEVCELIRDSELTIDESLSDSEQEELIVKRDTAQKHLLIRYLKSKRSEQYFVAGHEGAFGFGAKSYKHLVKFRDHLEKHSESVWNQYVKEHGQPKESVDLTISLLDDEPNSVDLDILEIRRLMNDMKLIEPFGSGWAEPVVKLRFQLDDVNHYEIGSDKSHVRFVFGKNDGFVAIVWSGAKFVSQANANSVIEVLGHLKWNYFNGVWSVNMICDTIKVES